MAAKKLPYESRIRKGIKLLDDNLGRKNWIKKIDLKKLRLQGNNTCVIGEVLGDYQNRYDLVGMDEDEEEYGFISNSGSRYIYQKLNSSWKKILKRLGAK